MSHLMKNYARQAVAFTHGEGCHLFDETGRRYLDGLAGIAVGPFTPGFTAHQPIAEQFAEIGTGVIPIADILEAGCTYGNARYVFVEQDMTSLGEMESVALSYQNLSRLVHGT